MVNPRDETPEERLDRLEDAAKRGRDPLSNDERKALAWLVADLRKSGKL